jgi:hypothetical protein
LKKYITVRTAPILVFGYRNSRRFIVHYGGCPGAVYQKVTWSAREPSFGAACLTRRNRRATVVSNETSPRTRLAAVRLVLEGDSLWCFCERSGRPAIRRRTKACAGLVGSRRNDRPRPDDRDGEATIGRQRGLSRYPAAQSPPAGPRGASPKRSQARRRTIPSIWVVGRLSTGGIPDAQMGLLWRVRQIAGRSHLSLPILIHPSTEPNARSRERTLPSGAIAAILP